MKKLLHDRVYLILQALSVLMLVLYLLYTNGFQSTPVFISWILALILLLATVVYSAVKRRWVVTAVNLAVGILCFISLMILPYSV